MEQKKSLKDLTIKDNFMFGAVMLDPDTYVIFICDFDPFGLEKYRYTQMKRCKEAPEFSMEDGEHTIFLSTKGKNDDEVPKELVNLLKFVGSPLSESEKAYDDEFISKLQATIQEVKTSREMGQGI